MYSTMNLLLLVTTATIIALAHAKPLRSSRKSAKRGQVRSAKEAKLARKSTRQMLESDFIVFTSATCEENGYDSIYSYNECKYAATIYGWKWNYNTDQALKDVVDGCSLRGGVHLYSNRASTCEVGAETPDWIPGSNGKATCKCSEFQPCLCRRRGVRAVAITDGTCEEAGYTSIYNCQDCRLAAHYLHMSYVWHAERDYVDVVNGCSLRAKWDLFCTEPATCTVGAATPNWIPLLDGKANCKCSEYQPCICYTRT